MHYLLSSTRLDPRQVAAGFQDRMIRAWNVAPQSQSSPEEPASGPTVGTKRSLAESVGSSAVNWSNDGASGSGAGRAAEGGVRGYDEIGQEQPSRFVGHSMPVYALTWSPDGRLLLTGGGDGHVRLWDPARSCGSSSASYARYVGHR